jgi:uncharacterized membrane protein
MEVFLMIIALIVIWVMISNVRNSLNSRFDVLQRKIDLLADELIKARKGQPAASKEEKKSILEDELLPKILAAKTPVPEKKAEEKERPTIKEEVKKPEEVIYSKPISAPPSHEPIVVAASTASKPKKPGFFERNPDLEKFIGENLANKIGIGILVLGIGFFVKYAIDQEWINEIGRVCIGLASGGILLGVAHRLRKNFVAFSSVLVGGGIAVLYLTIALAFHEYQLFSQPAAFILMLVITAFTVVLSLGYNRMELAILGILGGFASPFMVSSGEGNYVVLFIYILILDCGMLVLAYFKKWNVVNVICYAFTIILFGTWLAATFDGGETQSMIAGAMIFATLFYLTFFAMNIVNNIKEKTDFNGVEISMVLSNAFFYYAAGMVALDNIHGENFRGLFTVALGVFNFIFAYILYKNLRVDKKLVFLLIGLVLTFISLAAPVQLEGNFITLFWAAETALLLWLSQKSGIRLMKLGSVIIMALMVISLAMDWEQIYFGSFETTLPLIFNKGYITGIVAIASVVITIVLLKNEKEEDPYLVSTYKIALTAGGIFLLYMTQLLELRHQLFEFDVPYVSQNIIIGSYNMVFILGLILAEKKLGLSAVMKEVFAFWCVLAILSFLFFYQGEIVTARNEYLNGLISGTGFYFHYILVLILLAVAALSLKRMQALTEFNLKTHNAYSWFYVFFFVFIASAELDHIVLLLAYDPDTSIEHILTQNHKIGFPILWGLTSFLLIAVGLKMKKKHLRIISLTLFLLTLLKLFFVDIRGISEGGKIAAFISLGVLLLVVSFMYQRLKKLILADEAAADEKGTIA